LAPFSGFAKKPLRIKPYKMDTNILEGIREMVKEGELDMAFSLLWPLLGDGPLRDPCIVVNGRWSALRRIYNHGMMNHQEYLIEMAKVLSNLLDILSRVPTKDQPVSKQVQLGLILEERLILQASHDFGKSCSFMPPQNPVEQAVYIEAWMNLFEAQRGFLKKI
jgi:hypothetical protein